MADDAIVFALANPDPEILPEEVAEVRSDAIMATGRSDYPNQVNNVLGFPFIFRGALAVGATPINEEMKIACAHAIARLARTAAPATVAAAYGLNRLGCGAGTGSASGEVISSAREAGWRTRAGLRDGPLVCARAGAAGAWGSARP